MVTWSLVYYWSEWVIRLVMLVHVPAKRSAAAARTWLLFIFLLPWPGMIAYALIGGPYLPRGRVALQARPTALIRKGQARRVLPAGGEVGSHRAAESMDARQPGDNV